MAIPENENLEFDGQKQSESFDEDKQSLTSDGRARSEMRTFDQLPDVQDVTAEPEDSEDDAVEAANREEPLALDRDPQRPDAGVTSRTRGIDAPEEPSKD